MMTTLNEDLDSAIALESLVSQAASDAYVKDPSKAEQAAEYLAALKELNIDVLLDLQDKMKAIIDRATANAIDPENLGKLDPDKAVALMEELVEQKAVENFLKLRYTLIRAAVFAHIDAINAEQKVAYPTRAPGSLPVPKMGKKFTREGGKVKGTFDQEALAKSLTKEQYDRIYKRRWIEPQLIEGHWEEYRDDESLHALVLEQPSVMEKLRAAVVPTGFTTSSFHVRALTKEDKAGLTS